MARHQKNVSDKLHWLKIALEIALKINDDSVKSAFPALYENIAMCYEELSDADNAKRNYELSNTLAERPADQGPFYHGTKADLKMGDLLTPGNKSNYKSEFVMNHIYFTAIAHGAGLAAALAKGEGRERVYIVEPAGRFENDPNVTDKKFPGQSNATLPAQFSNFLKIHEINLRNRLVAHIFATEWFLKKSIYQ